MATIKRRTLRLDLEIIILSEVSPTEKERYHVISLTCGILKKIVQINLQSRNRLIDIENKYMITKGYGGGDKLGVFDCIHTPLYVK